jgi:regulator of CtrA degradation
MVVREREARAAAEVDPVPFAGSFVQSDAFKALFQEGMDLVEEAAAYLDGSGRQDAQNLTRPSAAIYARESMRLTTGLMHIASWLLVQRAVSEGQIGSRRAQLERNRLRLAWQGSKSPREDFERLPLRLRQLIGLSARLHARIVHLDHLLSEPALRPKPRENPIAMQRWLIEKAFAEKA